MSDAATWAISAANKFREVKRETTNPTTATLAAGLTYLNEAVRDLRRELEFVEAKIKNLSE